MSRPKPRDKPLYPATSHHHTADNGTGSHGYDNNTPAMQAIFVGHGPAFAPGRQIPAFANIELYNLMCRILGIEPAPNDGNPDWVNSVYQAN